MAKVKYHFALNDKGQIIDIADVTEETKHDKYYCLNCGDAMRPRLGSKNAHHFAHISTTPDCNPETYLHKLAKHKIKEKFDSSATFEISLHQVSKCLDKAICPFYNEEQCQSTDYKTYDLHKNYDTCVEEQVIDNYQADLLLTSSIKPNTPPILIEIYVSHKCEEAKIESGLRIIEIKIRNEEDIVKLLQSPITEYEEYSFDKNEIKCTFFNFNKSASDEKLEMRDIPKFYLFRSGSAYVSNMEEYPSCREVAKKDNKNAVLELGIDSFYLGNPSIYELGYAKATSLGYDVKNCSLCKYRKEAFDSYMAVPNICCLYKKYNTPQYPKGSEALNCQYFRKNTESTNLLKSALETATIIVCK